MIGTGLFVLNVIGKIIIAVLKNRGVKVPFWVALWV
jgi:hypothetical protein